MFTLGYKFKPWRSGKAIADGPSILKYIKETAEENKIVESIRFNKTLVEANWDSLNKTWKLKLEDTLSKTYSYIQCNFLYMCSGYYNYEKPYCPDFLGAKNFKGTIIHPIMEGEYQLHQQNCNSNWFWSHSSHPCTRARKKSAQSCDASKITNLFNCKTIRGLVR